MYLFSLNMKSVIKIIKLMILYQSRTPSIWLVDFEYWFEYLPMTILNLKTGLFDFIIHLCRPYICEMITRDVSRKYSVFKLRRSNFSFLSPPPTVYWIFWSNYSPLNCWELLPLVHCHWGGGSCVRKDLSILWLLYWFSCDMNTTVLYDYWLDSSQS